MGHAYLSSELKAVLLCREMKWTWAEYRAQPQWLITNLLFMLQSEAEQAKRKSNS